MKKIRTGKQWGPQLGIKNNEHEILDRKGKVRSICSNFIFMLPLTTNDKWDNDWFRFYAAEYCRVAHMKKRMLSKYKKRFPKLWMRKVDRFLFKNRITNVNEPVMYDHHILMYLYSTKLVPKHMFGELCRGIIHVTNALISVQPINADKSNVKYWKELHDRVLKIIRIMESDRNEKINKMVETAKQEACTNG